MTEVFGVAVETALKAIGVAVSVAALITVLQMALKRTSQPDKAKKFWSREDAAVWNEWVVAAVVALFVALFKLSIGRADIPPELLVALIVVLLGGCLGIPALVRFAFRWPNGGEYRGWTWIVVSDVLGLACIALVAGVGVDLYA